MPIRENLVHLAVVLALFGSYGAYAANTTDLPCKTTEECAAQAAKIGATVDKSKTSGSKAESRFSWLNRINKASIVMLAEEGIVTPDLGQKIATGVRYAIDQADQPNGKRPSDVLQLEGIMTNKIGPEVSLIHSGPNRQDMLATYRLAKLRSDVLAYSEAMNATRQRLLDLAYKNVDMLIPAYTNEGVSIVPASMRDVHKESVVYCRIGHSRPRLHAPVTLVCRSFNQLPPLVNFIDLSRQLSGRSYSKRHQRLNTRC